MSPQGEHHPHASGHQPRVRYWGAWRHVFDRIQDDEHLGNSRLEAFSDGVLAVAITLLILDVRVPAWTMPMRCCTSCGTSGRPTSVMCSAL